MEKQGQNHKVKKLLQLAWSIEHNPWSSKSGCMPHPTIFCGKSEALLTEYVLDRPILHKMDE